MVYLDMQQYTKKDIETPPGFQKLIKNGLETTTKQIMKERNHQNGFLQYTLKKHNG